MFVRQTGIKPNYFNRTCEVMKGKQGRIFVGGPGARRYFLPTILEILKPFTTVSRSTFSGSMFLQPATITHGLKGLFRETNWMTITCWPTRRYPVSEVVGGKLVRQKRAGIDALNEACAMTTS